MKLAEASLGSQPFVIAASDRHAITEVDQRIVTGEVAQIGDGDVSQLRFVEFVVERLTCRCNGFLINTKTWCSRQILVGELNSNSIR